VRGIGHHLAQILGLLDHIPVILLGVKVLKSEPEGSTTDKSNDGDNAIIPNQLRILRKRREGLADGRRKGRHEEVGGHDERLHVVGRLGEGVLIRSNVGEDFRYAN